MVTESSLNRIRIFYAAYFAAMGLVLPFFPIYLDGRGLDAVMIGFMTGLLALAKVVAPPWIGHLLDRRPQEQAQQFIVLASWMAAFAALLIAFALNLYLLAAIVLLFGIFWAAVLPLTDGLSVSVSESERADYGRLRAWGSVGFVITSLAGGAWLAGENITTFPFLLAGLMIVLAFAAQGFPQVERIEIEADARIPFSRAFYLLLSVAFIMQISHGAYYGFFSLYLADAGFSGWQIGLYWVIGVVAEIILMWRWSRTVQRLAPALIFSVCLLLAALRWMGTGLTTDYLMLAILQLLHAASFAAFHVAAIAWVKRIAPDSRHAAAQGLFSAAGFGLGSTIGIMGCGVIAGSLGYAMAFYICAAVALAGIPLALMLPKMGLNDSSGGDLIRE
ncbi:MFS transporter, PPP family, 3-phenylpropionic acid transporter [Mariprofundus ferrinatatus]|uniref:MFS transporter, PPP family, 3-phenylpropionic acid transporter n=1 Tax=Mariprofundus ferrinatatus TaxID=1921087 RepID=A0A2K8L6L4_9PROT|nr:MFS transporter [Mariprofundus ferrinatatus]ATX82873.1 MFS transporter, PPP family, 3-phenylpropionic acid transporter [Mariprofundus ferrinatatus]